MANPNPNRENLITQAERSKAERKRIASLGGKRAQEVLRYKRTMKEDAEWLLSLAMSNGELDDPEKIIEYGQLQGKNITANQASLVKIMNIIFSPNSDPKDVIKAVEFLRDTSGQKPTDNLNVQGNVNNPMEGLTTEELRALAYDKPVKKKPGRPKKVKD